MRGCPEVRDASPAHHDQNPGPVMDVSVGVWVATVAAVLAIIGADLFAVSRRPHLPTFRESVLWVLLFIGLAIGFGLLVWVGLRPGLCRAVLCRLAHGVLPEPGQPLRLRHHHVPVQGPGLGAADRAAHRHPAGAVLPEHLHRARSRGDRALLLGLLLLRGVPGLHRLEAREPRSGTTTTSSRRTSSCASYVVSSRRRTTTTG